jgi:hypothetical protein
MGNQMVTLDDLKGRPLEEVLQAVADQQATLIVRLHDGQQVAIEPKPHLKPLPELAGSVAKGWKEACVYAGR